MKKSQNNNLNLNSDKVIEVLDEIPFWSAPFGLKLLENIFWKKNITALDIGFGAGFPLTEIAMRLGNTCKIYGIDPWEAVIKRVRKKLHIYDISNVEIIKGVAEKIPLVDNSVNLITSNNGINNVSDLDKVLSECSRIMKSEGQFIQTVNLNGTMIEFYDILEKNFRELNMNSEIEKIKDHIYEKRKPLDEYIKKIENHGFKIKNIIHDLFDYKFVDGTTMLQHYFIRLAFLDSWKNIIPEKKQSQIFKMAEKKMNEKSDIDGFFKLSVPFVVIDCCKQ